MLNKLASIFSKVNNSDFKKLYSNLDCLSITASSSYTTADDIINSLFVIAFDKKPSVHYTFTKNINKLASVTQPLTLLQKFLLYKKAMSFVNFKIEKEANVPDFVNFSKYVEKIASAPKSVDGFVETDAFGKVAIVGEDKFIVNPVSEKVTALKLNASGLELIADNIGFAKLHEMLGDLKTQDLITLNDVDGILTATGSPEVINDLEHKVKELGFYCESVNQETGVEGEIPNYSLRIFTDKVASDKVDVEKKAEPEKLFGEDNKTANVIWENDRVVLTLTTFPEYSVYQALAKTPEGTKIPLFKQEVVKNQDGYALKEIEWFENNGKVDGRSVTMPIREDDATELLNAVQKDYESRNSEFEQNLDGLKVDNIDETNPHLTEAEQNLLNDFIKESGNKLNNIEVYANGKLVGVLNKKASDEKILIDDGTGVVVSYSVEDYGEKSLPMVSVVLRHNDSNYLLCSDAAYVEDLLSSEDKIDFLKDFKGFGGEFAKVGLDEEKISYYQEQTNSLLKDLLSKEYLSSGINPESSKTKGVEKKADNETEDTYNVEQETEGLKEIETPEDKFFEAKEEKPESFSASDLSENLAYIKQNYPENYSKVKEFLKQNLVGEDQKAYEFIDTLESTNFQFTEATEKSNLYDGHSQYQDLLQNKVLPLLEELPDYQEALKERVDPEDVK